MNKINKKQKCKIPKDINENNMNIKESVDANEINS